MIKLFKKYIVDGLRLVLKWCYHSVICNISFWTRNTQKHELIIAYIIWNILTASWYACMLNNMCEAAEKLVSAKLVMA